MIQIDDSGSGSLVGGTCIGAIRAETGEYVYDFIPIYYYREKNFKQKKYLYKCSEIVFNLLKQLSYDYNEEIEICQGYMFDIARKQMRNRNIKFESTKIGDPLQDKIEQTFQDYAIELGLPPQYVKYTKYPLHFHRILRWVYADFQKRSALCKTGWKSWKKYSSIKIARSVDILYKPNYTCLRCGNRIAKGSKVKRLEYESNCPNIVYLHYNCP